MSDYNEDNPHPYARLPQKVTVQGNSVEGHFTRIEGPGTVSEVEVPKVVVYHSPTDGAVVVEIFYDNDVHCGVRAYVNDGVVFDSDQQD